MYTFDFIYFCNIFIFLNIFICLCMLHRVLGAGARDHR